MCDDLHVTADVNGTVRGSEYQVGRSPARTGVGQIRSPTTNDARSATYRDRGVSGLGRFSGCPFSSSASERAAFRTLAGVGQSSVAPGRSGPSAARRQSSIRTVRSASQEALGIDFRYGCSLHRYGCRSRRVGLRPVGPTLRQRDSSARGGVYLRLLDRTSRSSRTTHRLLGPPNCCPAR